MWQGRLALAALGSARPRRPCHIFLGGTCDLRRATCASDITTFRLATVACRIVASRSRPSYVVSRTSRNHHSHTGASRAAVATAGFATGARDNEVLPNICLDLIF